MERYSEYKDSGVKWLGKIPSHWEVMPLKSFIKFEKGKTPKEFSDENIGLPYLTMDYLRSRDNKIVKYPTSSIGLFEIEESEALVLWDGANAGEFILSKKGYLGSTMAKISGYREYFNNLYFYYFLKMLEPTSKDFANGTTIPHFDASILINYHYPIPPIDEQIVIGSYLDAATSKIDKAIDMQQKMIDLLNERKQIIIQNAVTKGLDENVEMKDSGVEWIGMIPKHWGLYPLRKYLNVNSKRNMPNAQLLSVTREEGVIVRNTESKEENHNFIPDDLSNYKYVRKGQFVINKMKSWQGSYGVSNFNGIVSPAYFVYDLNYPNTTYFSMAIRSKMFSPFFSKYSKGIRIDQWDLVPEALKVIPFLEPPVEEQIEIVEYLGNLIPKIESKISNCQRQIALLQERKQIIINEVVTGKVKVS